MNLTVLSGILLIVLGLIAAGAGIVGLGESDVRESGPAVVEQAQQQPASGAPSMLFAVISGLSIAGGGALIGLGMGSFRHPRKIVPPNSPQEEPAATTRPTT